MALEDQDPADELEAQRQRLANALRTGVVENPDALAADRAEAARRGMPVSRLRAIREVNGALPPVDYTTDLPERAPATSAFLANPANAAVAHDDIENLAGVERIVARGFYTPEQTRQLVDQTAARNAREQGQSAARTPLGRFIERQGPAGRAVANVFRGAGEGASRIAGGLARTDQTLFGGIEDFARRQYDRVGIPIYDFRPDEQGRFSLQRVEPAADGTTRTGQMTRALETPALGYEAGTTWEEVKARPLQNVIPFAIESGLVSLPDMAVAMAVLPAYVVARTGGIGQDRAENDGREEATVADLLAALPAASASAFLERLGTMGILGVGDELVRGGVRGVLGAAGRAGVQEGLTEAGQSGVEYLGTNLGTEAGFNPVTALDQMAAGAVAGTPFGATVRAATATVEVVTRRNDQGEVDAAAGEQAAQTLGELATLAEASKLRERDPQTFQQFIEQASEGTPVENVYVEAQAFAQALNDAGVPLEDVVAAIPALADQLPGALASGGDLRMTAGEFATHIAGTDATAALLPHLRTDPFGMSQAQAKDFMATRGEALQAEVEAAAAGAQLFERLRVSRETVQTRITEELNTTGRFTKDVNAAYASLPAAFYDVMGARLGLTAEQAAERYPLKFASEMPSSAGREVMDQEADTVELVHFSDSEDMKVTDPSKWGATRATQNSERERRNAGAPMRTYFGVRGVYKGEPVTGISRRPFQYQAQVPASKLYDFDGDPQGLKPAEGSAMEIATAYEKAIQAAGFMGYRSDAVLPGAVAVFDKVEVSLALVMNQEQDRAQPLVGAPKSNVPSARARMAAEEYMAKAGLPYNPPREYVRVDPKRAKEIAQAFEDMKHDPADPEVAAAYRAMIDETLAQWGVIKATGLKVEFIRGEDPYAATPRLAILDVIENNHLWVFPTDSGFGSSDLDVSDNPLLEKTGEVIDGRELVANDVFRIAHDYFGHIKDGNGFRADGEENAWQSHAAMYSPLARRAMTTETRGQNSWVNFGPKAEFNRTASAGDTVYADQKIGLLPEWVSSEGFLGGPTGTANGTPVTETAAFKAWFGDSKVVDGKGGPPLVVYHGTRGDQLEAFDPAATGKTTVLFSTFDVHRQGFYFAEDESFARTFAEQGGRRGGGTIMPVYLSIQNPLDVSTDRMFAPQLRAVEEISERAAEIDPSITNPRHFTQIAGTDTFWEALDTDEGGDAFVQAAREAGYDGFRMTEKDDDGRETTVWVALDPTQIKSVNNRGTFDPADTRILYQADLPRGYVGPRTAAEQAAIDEIDAVRKRMGDEWQKAIAVIAAETRAEIEAKSPQFIGDPILDIAVQALTRQRSNTEAPVFAAVRELIDEEGRLETERLRLVAERLGPAEYEAMQQLDRVPRSQTDTPAFKAWFGDSKVVSAEGQPLIAFHGTGADFDTFDPVDSGNLSNNNWMGQLGSWFAAPSASEEYDEGNAEATAEVFSELRSDGQPVVMPVFLSIQNPAEFEGYENLTEQRDAAGGAKAFRAQLIAAGHDGVVVRESSTDGGQFRDDWVAFDPTQIKSAIGNRGAFDPLDPSILAQRNRGQIAFGADVSQTPSVISLLRAADLSTFIHETGHFFLEATAHMANAADAPADIVADMATVLNWMRPGMTLADWNAMSLEERRPFHEKWARGFEAYHFEGRSPSLALRDVFRRFSAWLKNVYKSLTALDVELTDEVRQVMDRMLATEAEITEMEQARGLTPAFANKPEFASDDEWEEYQRLAGDATAEAIEQLEQRSARDMRWASGAKDRYLRSLQREGEEQRKAVRAEVTAEVMAEPVNRARAFLRRGLGENGEPVEGAAKLDLATLKSLYGDEGTWTGLRRGGKYGEVSTDGLHPDAVASMFGYPNGEALIEDLVNGEDSADKIKGLTDQRMLERYGDLSDAQSIERAANEAVANEARGKFVAAEMAMADKAIGKKSILNSAAKEFAAQVVNRLELKRLRPAQYLAAQGRAAKAAEKALKADDLPAFATAKRNQLVNLHTGRAVQQAQKDVEKTMRLFTRIVSAKDDSISKSRNMDLVNAARAVLASYGVGRVKNDPAGYMKALSQYDPTLYADIEPFVNGARGDAKPVVDLTYEQFAALRDTVNQLWVLSRRTKQIEIDGKLIDREVVTTELGLRLDTLGIPAQAGVDRAPTDRDNRVRDLLGARAALRRVESWARGTDGENSGPFRKYIWNPISVAADAYRAESGVYIRRFRELLDGMRAELKPGDLKAPEIGYTFGGKSELFHALLHTGNGSNKSKLLLGRGWGKKNADGSLDDSRWQSFVDRLHTEGVLTEKDWTFVQAVWDLLEETKPGAQKAHRAIYGRYFDEVSADPVDTPFGQLRGGYVPAMTDGFLVQDAALRAEQEAIEGGDSAMFPAASNGFTKSRVEDYTRELALDLRLLPMHIDKVLKFTHLGPPVRDVARILKDRGFSKKLQAYDPTAQTDLLLPWLQRAAKQLVETPSKGRAGKVSDRFFSAVRSRVGMQLMFANVVNTAQQVTGFSNVLLRVKAPILGDALWRYVRDPKGVAEAAASQSVFLTNRMSSDIFEARQTIAQLTKLDPSKTDEAVAFLQRNAYFMQSALQNVMDVVSWTAAFNQAVGKGESDRDAARFADSVIRETQGTMAPEDVSRFETGPAFIRVFTQFAGYFNMMANLNATEVQLVARDVGLRKGAGRLFYVYLMGFAVPALIGDAIAKALRGGWEDEEGDGYLDDMFAWFFSSQAKFALAAVPVAGQAANAAMGAFTKLPYDDRISMSPAVSVIESGLGTPAEVYQSIVDGESFNRADTRDALNLLGVLTGLPIGALAKPVGYGVGVAQGDIAPTSPLDAARGVVTGAPSPESRQ